MVKLATARENRLYGPRLTRNRSEYMNAGIYLFSVVVLLCGFFAQLSKEPKSGLVLLLIAFALIIAVNCHDLIAHLAAIDCRMSLIEFDPQLAFVEFAVPIVQALGSSLLFLGILILLIQEEKGNVYKYEQYALNLLVAGPILWVLGSIHNSCQTYERADGHIQVLQQSVHVPFLLGSLLLLVGAIINLRLQSGSTDHGTLLLGIDWVWFGVSGSVLLFVGGITNVVKVFKMQQIGGQRLEKLRGGAQERLIREREGQLPLIIEEHHHRRKTHEVPEQTSPITGTPYRDVLVGRST